MAAAGLAAATAPIGAWASPFAELLALIAVLTALFAVEAGWNRAYPAGREVPFAGR
jgi:hypothetical protein